MITELKVWIFSPEPFSSIFSYGVPNLFDLLCEMMLETESFHDFLLHWFIVLRALVRCMRKLFKLSCVGDLLFLRTFISSLHSSVNHGFLILVERVEVYLKFQ